MPEQPEGKFKSPEKRWTEIYSEYLAESNKKLIEDFPEYERIVEYIKTKNELERLAKDFETTSFDISMYESVIDEINQIEEDLTQRGEVLDRESMNRRNDARHRLPDLKRYIEGIRNQEALLEKRLEEFLSDEQFIEKSQLFREKLQENIEKAKERFGEGKINKFN